MGEMGEWLAISHLLGRATCNGKCAALACKAAWPLHHCLLPHQCRLHPPPPVQPRSVPLTCRMFCTLRITSACFRTSTFCLACSAEATRGDWFDAMLQHTLQLPGQPAANSSNIHCRQPLCTACLLDDLLPCGVGGPHQPLQVLVSPLRVCRGKGDHQISTKQ